MIGLAILFGIISMIGFGLANTFSQPLSQKVGAAPLLMMRSVTIVIVLGIISILARGQFRGQWGSAGAAFVLGFTGYLPLLAFTHGVKISRLSIMSPIAGLSTIVTVLLAFWFLHTPLHALQWLAVAVIVLANIIVSVDVRDWTKSQLLRASSGIPFALIAALGWGLFFFFLVYPTRAIGPWLSAFFVEVGVGLAASLHVLTKYRQQLQIRQILWPGIIANGLFICIASTAFTFGVSHYNVPIVATFANSPAVLSTFLGIYIFKEKLRTLELYGAGAMILGVIIISATS